MKQRDVGIQFVQLGWEVDRPKPSHGLVVIIVRAKREDVVQAISASRSLCSLEARSFGGMCTCEKSLLRQRRGGMWRWRWYCCDSHDGSHRDVE